MKYITTETFFLDQYNTQTINVAPYSRLLKVMIRGHELTAIFESCESNNNGLNKSKTFYFNVMTGLHQNDSYIDERYVYFDTVRVQEGDMIEYYHIFVDEIKPIEEIRDDKLNHLVDDEQEF